jgi:hypothetical protein
MTAAQAKLNVFIELVRSEHPTWNYDRTFQQAVVQSKMAGGFEKTQAAAPKDGQAPEIAKELQRHKQLRETRDQAVPTHVARLQKIRHKMEADPALTFDSAFSQVCQEEMSPPLLASTAPVQTRPATHVEAAPKPKSKGVLVTGGFYNLLPGMEEDEGEE